MKNKKPLIGVIVVLIIVGVTIAYFSTTSLFDNEFVTATYKTTSTEVFDGPSNWKPGEEIAKTVTTTNEGSVNIAVRVSYTENWKDKNGTDLNPQPEDKVTINLDHINDWKKEGNYYYYKYPLEPGKTTSSFMKSVTLNSDAINSTTCTTSADGMSKTCEALDSIVGAHYTLTVTIETIQFDAYEDAWNPNITLAPKVYATVINRQNEGEITTGDIIKIGDTEEFYVVSSDEDETILLAHYNLLVGRIYSTSSEYTEIASSEEGYGLQNSTALGEISAGRPYTGIISFSDRTYWNGKVGEGLDYPGSYSTPDYPEVYDENSNIYEYVENYKCILEEEGIEIKKARLLTYQEALNLGCTHGNPGTCRYAPDWVRETSYWLGSASGSSLVWSIRTQGNLRSYNDYKYGHMDCYGIRPVIVIHTDYIPT